MKRFLFTIVCCVTFATACSTKSDSEIDKSTVWFEAEEYSLPAQGGQVIIPVQSTGVDYATIKYTFEDAWTSTQRAIWFRARVGFPLRLSLTTQRQEC